ncbi:MAG TPA: glycosyltransferase [Thiotrichales bacterium]|nr:glycosyltransferase [Thiotrichales bacterium]
MESADIIPEVTITLTRYNEPDWLVLQTLESLAEQAKVRGEVLFLDQSETSSIDIDCLNSRNETLTFRHLIIPARSLSYARNEAIRLAGHDIILYIDSDAIADPLWAHHLASALQQSGAAIAGGKIILKWHKKPIWLAKARVVREQYSCLDLGDRLVESDKVVGASFGIHRGILSDEAYFDERLGRRNGKLISGEETDLCDRARDNGHRIVYEGRSIVQHQVLPERITYSWVMRRMFHAGVNRAVRGGNPSPTHPPNLWDYAVLPVILPSYAAGYVYGKTRNVDEDK